MTLLNHFHLGHCSVKTDTHTFNRLPLSKACTCIISYIGVYLHNLHLMRLEFLLHLGSQTHALVPRIHFTLIH